MATNLHLRRSAIGIRCCTKSRFTSTLAFVLALVAFFPAFVHGIASAQSTTQTTTVTAGADTRVASAYPTTNYGSAGTLGSDSSPKTQSFVRFTTGTLPGTVVSAKLRLFVTEGATAASGAIWGMSNTTWSETSVTYNTRPTINGVELARFNNVLAGAWVESDVIAVVKGSGTYSFGISQTGSDNTNFASREHGTTSKRPQLIVITSATTSDPTPTPTPSTSATIWIPAPRTSWQWQLTGTVDQSIDAQMYDIDLFDNDASVVASLHAKGRKAVCYFSAGSYENWRPDAGKFPTSVRGKPLDGWAGENWLDIRQLSVIGPIMEARIDLCKSKGFDAVEPDNIDGYANNNGFPLTYQDQINYNKFLAEAAHKRGLSIGLKNDLDQVRDLLPYFDWALNEECFQYSECDMLTPFINAGKAIFNVEYGMSTSSFCPQANSMNFNSLRKNLDLDAYRAACR